MNKWKMIEALNWSEASLKHRGYNDVKMFMVKNFNPELSNDLSAFVTERVEELRIAMERYANENSCRVWDGGDDSYGDVLYHVVGKGNEFCCDILAHPEKLMGVDYVESFSYCFPYKEDYDNLCESIHKDRAIKSINELTRQLNKNNPTPDDIKVIKVLMNSFLCVLAGDWSGSIPDDWNDDTYEMYHNYQANDCQALFANYLSDVAQYML